jgi:hypothetical protein
MTNGQGYGLNMPEPFVSYDLDTSCWKTSQASFLQDLGEFSETWPSAGMMQNGKCYRRRRLVRRNFGRGFSLWPAPTTTDWKDVGKPSVLARLWTDPNYHSHKKPGYKWAAEYGTNAPVALWEWLMGYPIGWTDLKDSETP